MGDQSSEDQTDSGFQLPLSGSHPEQFAEVISREIARLSTPSLGITKLRGSLERLSWHRTLSTPSLGITEGSTIARVLIEPWDFLFQLPLSGSRGCRAPLLPPGPWGTFNSLSRDHSLPAKLSVNAHPILSTPSLGITYAKIVVMRVVDVAFAFNSLSRDHHGIAGGIIKFFMNFQLPLSGSQARICVV